ncbi:dynein regulatory complex protein 1 [Spea bombifrons]|uniref:dynein regulatory complex protein 1 n=1 Tax=Spea bombifrons TaxID=233779 RepID=UPI00234AB1FE|nr:dynein regulatory complex protein 1 [Spea bombifrons]
MEARRLRISARLEAKRREALGEDPNSHKEQKEEPRKSRKQMEDSRQRLAKLVSDGTQLVTNIQIAADARETQRRADEEELRRLRVEKLDNEAKTSLEKFEDITQKWLSSGTRRVPQELWELLNLQQQQCGRLIEDKNKLIGELQQELKRKDELYVKDLKKQAEDVGLLIERMEEQIRSLTKTFREELLNIEKAFESERRDLLNSNRRKWEEGMEARRGRELEDLTLRMKKVEEYERQLNQLRVQDGEEYNVIKIKLETDVQILQQQLQQMKATYQLNQEKLEYNYQVLKKRDEENTITKSQQKRRITRLQDVLNNLRIKLDKQVKECREQNAAQSDDIQRLAEQCQDLQKKMRHFAAADAKKFHDIWVMNEEEMKGLVHRALEADRIIQEQQLGLPWKTPDLWFMDNVGPLVPQKQKKKSASVLAQEVMASAGSDESLTSSNGQSARLKAGVPGSAEQPSPPFSARTVKRILERVSEESGFLIEAKLKQLLSPLEKDERSLLKLDSIFGALGIEDEDDVYELVDFFLRYKQEDAPGQDDGDTDRSDTSAGDDRPRQGVLIHPNDVVRALRAFVADFHKPSEKLSQSRPAGWEERDSSEDAAYWAEAARVVPESRLRVWDALESALEKYHDVLSGRSQLITETSSLRQQNAELRMLLHQYLNSRINQELEIPPTQMLQMEPQN